MLQSDEYFVIFCIILSNFVEYSRTMYLFVSLCRIVSNYVEFYRIKKKTLSIFCFTRKIFCESAIAIAFLLYHKGRIHQNCIPFFIVSKNSENQFFFYSLTILTIFSFFRCVKCVIFLFYGLRKYSECITLYLSFLGGGNSGLSLLLHCLEGQSFILQLHNQE